MTPDVDILAVRLCLGGSCVSGSVLLDDDAFDDALDRTWATDALFDEAFDEVRERTWATFCFGDDCADGACDKFRKLF